MRWMRGWSWEDLNSCPEDVYDVIVDMINDPDENGGFGDL